MGDESRHVSGLAFARRSLAPAAALVFAACVALTLGAGAAIAKPAKTVWLCKSGKTDPCTQPLTTTVVTYKGGVREETVQKVKKASRPPIDCFYVYPTVSEQKTTNANLEIEPQETQIAIDQASRFSQDCKVYAPMYPQLTLAAINNPEGVPPQASVAAYVGVLEAFDEYMAKYNKGRGFVLIGHSQGSLMLKQLIKEQIDPNPALRSQLVSAVLLGGNVLVPEGQRSGADFQNVPSCATAFETHCVIGYSSFAKEPPQGAFFGRVKSPLTNPQGVEGGGLEVLCVNPALFTQDGGTGALQPFASTTPFPGVLGNFTETPSAATPWVASPGLFTAQCKHENNATWLQVGLAGSPSEGELKEREEHHELVKEALGPEWGLHLYDVNIALGNLVHTVALQAQAYAFENP
jgi:Protein of unknown function (DUF3089)